MKNYKALITRTDPIISHLWPYPPKYVKETAEDRTQAFKFAVLVRESIAQQSYMQTLRRDGAIRVTRRTASQLLPTEGLAS